MRRLPLIAVAAVLCLAPLAAQGKLTRQDAERFHAKLEKIVEYGNTPGKRTAARSTGLLTTSSRRTAKL